MERAYLRWVRPCADPPCVHADCGCGRVPTRREVERERHRRLSRREKARERRLAAARQDEEDRCRLQAPTDESLPPMIYSPDALAGTVGQWVGRLGYGPSLYGGEVYRVAAECPALDWTPASDMTLTSIITGLPLEEKRRFYEFGGGRRRAGQ